VNQRFTNAAARRPPSRPTPDAKPAEVPGPAPPGPADREEARALRRQGFTVTQIAAYFSIPLEETWKLLGEPPDRQVHCRKCGAVIHRAATSATLPFSPVGLCSGCLALSPEDTFGKRLRALRLSHGMTQSGLAEATGVSLRTLRLYEQESRKHPPWPLVVKLARLFGPALVGLPA
jgi:DNA-binding XRE family transcriptional regulator